jgi:hypothetical protein
MDSGPGLGIFDGPRRGADFFPLGGAVDVLFVIDNSCSMYEEQSALANNGPDFLLPLIASDIHVGVISTDMADATHSGRLRQVGGMLWIDNTFTQVDAVNFFDQAITMGTSGNWNEQGIDAAYEALAVLGAGYNAGFSRPNAWQHIVVLSDENDHSNLLAANFVTWMSTFKAAANMTVFHSIVSPNPLCPTASEVGTEYLLASTSTGGLVASVCQNDYAPIMAALANLIIPVLPDEPVFALTESADPATIEVWVTEPGLAAVLVDPADWTYDAAENAVELLNLAIVDGLTVEILYRKLP